MFRALWAFAIAGLTGILACNALSGVGDLSFGSPGGAGAAFGAGAGVTATATGAGGSGDVGAAGSVGGTAGAGGTSCSGAEVLCDGVCADTSVDESHCGGCGTACAPMLSCVASVCVATSCAQVLASGAGTDSKPYWIATPTGPKELYCDLAFDDGGWTLVGQVSGKFDMYAAWLRADVNTDALKTPVIEDASYSSINAIEMAVNLATEVRLSNSDLSQRVRWSMPSARTIATWWNHAAGQSAIGLAADTTVDAASSTGETKSCYQNAYGVMPLAGHGGSYPFSSKDSNGTTQGGDPCIAVGVMLSGTTADGFTQNGNGFDAPSSETDWPSGALGQPPRVSVWLR